MSWKCFDYELFENHLGVALIQPGDSVIVANERFCGEGKGARKQSNKGGTA